MRLRLNTCEFGYCAHKATCYCRDYGEYRCDSHDITARDLLDQEERALDAVLSKIQELMVEMGEQGPYSVLLSVE